MAPTMTTTAARRRARDPRVARACGPRTRGAGGTGICGGASWFIGRRPAEAPAAGPGPAARRAGRRGPERRRSRCIRRRRSSYRRSDAIAGDVALGPAGLERQVEAFLLVARLELLDPVAL